MSLELEEKLSQLELEGQGVQQVGEAVEGLQKWKEGAWKGNYSLVLVMEIFYLVLTVGISLVLKKEEGLSSEAQEDWAGKASPE